MATTTALPSQPAAASSAALEAAITETNTKLNGGSGNEKDVVVVAADGETNEQNADDDDDDDDANAKVADDSIRTVFTDPDNFNVKHPLYHKWTLWFDNPSAKGMIKAPGGKDSWGEDLNKVVDFDSVEEFWGLYNNIIPPSALPPKANYYLFQEGILPAWEDTANTNGGKWSIQLPRDKTRSGIDRLWLYTMLAAIGETLDTAADGEASSSSQADLVTGVIMSARPQFYRIAIWTRKAEDPLEESEAGSVGRRLLDIGRHLKTQILGYDLNAKLQAAYTTEVEFQSHKESEKKKGKKFTI